MIGSWDPLGRDKAFNGDNLTLLTQLLNGVSGKVWQPRPKTLESIKRSLRQGDIFQALRHRSKYGSAIHSDSAWRGGPQTLRAGTSDNNGSTIGKIREARRFRRKEISMWLEDCCQLPARRFLPR